MHKKIGIIGGMSPESTITYYKHITHQYTKRFGDHSYPPVLIYSVSFQDYIDWPNTGRWDLIAEGLSEAAKSLQAAGADVILIATNTMHIVFDEVQAALSVPVISLLDVVGEAIQQKGISKVGLLGRLRWCVRLRSLRRSPVYSLRKGRCRSNQEVQRRS